MGASGAGKTTLLNILSQRTSTMKEGRIKGEIVINDQMKLDHHLFSKIGAYVTQDDILF